MRPQRFTSIVIAIIASQFSLSMSAFASDEYGIAMRQKIVDIHRECDAYADVLAATKIEKWRKEGKDVEKAFSGNAHDVMSKIQQQQCISVQMVLILRLLKANVSAKEAMHLKIDSEIEKNIAIIEKTL